MPSRTAAQGTLANYFCEFSTFGVSSTALGAVSCPCRDEDERLFTPLFTLTTDSVQGNGASAISRSLTGFLAPGEYRFVINGFSSVGRGPQPSADRSQLLGV